MLHRVGIFVLQYCSQLNGSVPNLHILTFDTLKISYWITHDMFSEQSLNLLISPISSVRV